MDEQFFQCSRTFYYVQPKVLGTTQLMIRKYLFPILLTQLIDEHGGYYEGHLQQRLTIYKKRYLIQRSHSLNNEQSRAPELYPSALEVENVISNRRYIDLLSFQPLGNRCNKAKKSVQKWQMVFWNIQIIQRQIWILSLSYRLLQFEQKTFRMSLISR